MNESAQDVLMMVAKAANRRTSRAGRPVVLQVSKLYPPWIGGVERVVRQFAEGVSDEFESKVLVCRSAGLGSFEVVNGVQVFRAGSVGMLFSVPISPSFPFVLRKFARHADIVHLHLPFPLGTLAWDCSAPARLVINYHSDIVRQRWLLPIYASSLRRVLEDADIILVSSPILKRTSRWLEPYQHKCRVVPFFVDLVDYPLCNGGSVRVHGVGYDRGKPMVLFVGRLVYYKGTEYLIRAMQHADATLTIIGDGPMRGRLESLSRELGLQRKISFLGHVPAETLHEYYRACRCLVLPSVEPTEAFGLVQLEAMAYGKPVVNTCLPTGVPFVSVHGETGFTVPPRDPGALAEAINRLCADEDLCVRLGRQARQRVEMMFSKDVVLNQIKSIYWELLRGRPKGV